MEPSDLWKDILAFGGLAGAFVAIGRAFSILKDKGAKEQKIDDRLDRLENEKDKGRERDIKLFEKIESIIEGQHEIKIGVVTRQGELSERITKLENQGCAPLQNVKKSEG